MAKNQVDEYSLAELADIQPGYPFRGKLPLDPAGEAYVVQFRHVAVGEPLDDKKGRTLDRVNLPGRKPPTYLRPGDVIFMGKGTRTDAVIIGDVPDRTVCTPNFYHIRLKPEARDLIPEFLVWQLNHESAQRYFASCSQGSVAPSITKSQLQSLAILIPPLLQQRLMTNLADTAAQERHLLHQLIENRQRMLDAVGYHILNSENNTRT